MSPIIKVWKCLSNYDRSSLMSNFDFTYAKFEGQIQGKEWDGDVKEDDPSWPGMERCLPVDISAAAGDDDWARKWVNTHTKEAIAEEVDKENGVANVANLLKAFINGATLAEDEHAIAKVIQALSEGSRCTKLLQASRIR